jgi:putative Mg2+ transporter-C (MgtC) family protein
MARLVGFDVAQLVSLAQIALAMLLGAGSAALLVTLGEVMIIQYNRPELVAAVRADPLRILSAVITGVSFLGAGTIIRRGNQDHVEGLTTAASLLMAAGIGAGVALAQTVVAVGTTAFVYLTLHAFGGVERRLHDDS